MAHLKTKRGRRVTKKLADEAEAGYDLRKATPERTRGRPALGANEKGASPRISYRVPADLYEAARRRAGKQGRTVSALAREALERHLSE